MNDKLVRGSLKDISMNSGASLAETFMGVDALVLVDISASMGDSDCQGDRRRYDVACEQLVRLQNDLPGKIGLIAWGTYPYFCPGGLPKEPAGTTDLSSALDYIKPADGCGIKIIIISDGEPDDRESALRKAGKFKSKLDCIYVGPEIGYGRLFMQELAAMSGGICASQSVKEIAQLSKTVTQLLKA